MATKKTNVAVEETQPVEAAAQPNKLAEIQALKASAYDLFLERSRLENIQRQVEARIQELQQPST